MKYKEHKVLVEQAVAEAARENQALADTLTAMGKIIEELRSELADLQDNKEIDTL